MKHPLHPVLVNFPIAFLSAGFLTDVAFWRTGEFFWARASLWLLGVGLLLGVVAAVVGLIDFFGIERVRQLSAGLTHLLLTVIALALAMLNVMLRLSSTQGYIVFFGLILSALTAVLVGVGGWFGGELTFHHGIGMFRDEGE